jgi:aminocarboxymuconate-semialdehyde decarboxylase
MKTIDTHAHIIPEGCFEPLRKKHQEYVPRVTIEGDNINVRTRWERETCPRSIVDLDLRLAEMERVGVKMQVLSVSPTLTFYNIEPEAALDLNAAQNDAIAQVVEKFPDRFVGLATVPLQNIALSVDELERAVKELGLRGVEINTHIRGRNLDEKELWPFYQKAQELGVPIMLHPGFLTATDRLERYYLANLIGYPVESTIAGASIIFGGVLKDFPELKFYFVHGGGFLPYQRGRFEHGYRVREEPKVSINQPPSEYFRLLYFDTVTHYLKALEYLISSVGSNRVVLGSDYPFDMADPEPVERVQSLTTISESDKERILWNNAAELFKLD